MVKPCGGSLSSSCQMTLCHHLARWCMYTVCGACRVAVPHCPSKVRVPLRLSVFVGLRILPLPSHPPCKPCHSTRRAARGGAWTRCAHCSHTARPLYAVPPQHGAHGPRGNEWTRRPLTRGYPVRCALRVGPQSGWPGPAGTLLASWTSRTSPRSRQVVARLRGRLDPVSLPCVFKTFDRLQDLWRSSRPLTFFKTFGTSTLLRLGGSSTKPRLTWRSRT